MKPWEKRDAANYGVPEFMTLKNQRCRDCAEIMRKPGVGFANYKVCKLHDGADVQPSRRCDKWHARGTLL